MSKQSFAEKTLREIGGDIGDLLKGGLESNKAINPIADKFFGVPQLAYKTFKNGDVRQAAKDVFFKDGKLDYGKVAGSFVGASAAARVASGGGIYKDSRGQNNFIGIPFV